MNNNITLQLAPYKRIKAAGCDIEFKYGRGGKAYRISLLDRDGNEHMFAYASRSGTLNLEAAEARAKAGRWGETTSVHEVLVQLAEEAEALVRGQASYQKVLEKATKALGRATAAAVALKSLR